jgi:hypothetical protein
MAVRTKRLAQGIMGGDVALYTVPAERTTIVRYLNFSNEAAGSITVTLRLRIGAVELVLRRITLAQQAGVSFDTWLVLQPGDELLLRSGAGAAGLHYHLSGSELVGVA